MSHVLKEFPAVPASVAAVRRVVEAAASRCGVDETALSDIRLAASEAATNAIVHGRSGEDARIFVRMEFGDEELVIVVRDEGTGIKPRSDSPGMGLGLPVISSVAKRLDIRSSPQGTEVHMTFPCPAAGAHA